MVKHIVMWKLKQFDSPNGKQEAIDKIKTLFVNLQKELSIIKKAEVLVNSDKAPQDNFDATLIVDFESFEDLKAYQIYPSHKKISEYIKSIRVDRAAIDYEY